jgi:hypothetical protein
MDKIDEDFQGKWKKIVGWTTIQFSKTLSGKKVKLVEVKKGIWELIFTYSTILSLRFHI